MYLRLFPKPGPEERIAPVSLIFEKIERRFEKAAAIYFLKYPAPAISIYRGEGLNMIWFRPNNLHS